MYFFATEGTDINKEDLTEYQKRNFTVVRIHSIDKWQAKALAGRGLGLGGVVEK